MGKEQLTRLLNNNKTGDKIFLSFGIKLISDISECLDYCGAIPNSKLIIYYIKSQKRIEGLARATLNEILIIENIPHESSIEDSTSLLYKLVQSNRDNDDYMFIDSLIHCLESPTEYYEVLTFSILPTLEEYKTNKEL